MPYSTRAELVTLYYLQSFSVVRMCKLQIMKCYQFCLCRVRHAVVNYCKFSILEYFHGLLEQLKTNFQTNFRFKRVLGFVIEYA